MKDFIGGQFEKRAYHHVKKKIKIKRRNKKSTLATLFPKTGNTKCVDPDIDCDTTLRKTVFSDIKTETDLDKVPPADEQIAIHQLKISQNNNTNGIEIDNDRTDLLCKIKANAHTRETCFFPQRNNGLKYQEIEYLKGTALTHGQVEGVIREFSVFFTNDQTNSGRENGASASDQSGSNDNNTVEQNQDDNIVSVRHHRQQNHQPRVINLQLMQGPMVYIHDAGLNLNIVHLYQNRIPRQNQHNHAGPIWGMRPFIDLHPHRRQYDGNARRVLPPRPLNLNINQQLNQHYPHGVGDLQHRDIYIVPVPPDQMVNLHHVIAQESVEQRHLPSWHVVPRSEVPNGMRYQNIQPSCYHICSFGHRTCIVQCNQCGVQGEVWCVFFKQVFCRQHHNHPP